MKTRTYSQPYLAILEKRCRKGKRLVTIGTVLIAIGIILILIGAFGPTVVHAGPVIGTTVEHTEPEHKNTEVIPIKDPVILDMPGMEVPEEIRQAAEEIGNMYHIAPEFIIATCWVESNYNRHAVNKAGTCFGLMQVYEKYHWDRMERLGVTDIYSIYGNMLVGTDYLAELFDKYEDPATVLMVYNGDDNALNEGYYSDYADSVLTLSANLERKAGK